MSYTKTDVANLVDQQQNRLNKLHNELDKLLIIAKTQAIDDFVTQDNWLTKRVSVSLKIEIVEQADQQKGIDLGN